MIWCLIKYGNKFTYSVLIIRGWYGTEKQRTSFPQKPSQRSYNKRLGWEGWGEGNPEWSIYRYNNALCFHLIQSWRYENKLCTNREQHKHVSWEFNPREIRAQQCSDSAAMGRDAWRCTLPAAKNAITTNGRHKKYARATVRSTVAYNLFPSTFTH
jgi:hypothetical protein